MAKDKIMPQMGFQKTLGRDWFRNKPNLEFPWGMDDKAYFEGALGYVKQLRHQRQPWMLTLLTVGTHQPYSAPEDYLQRYPDSKQAAVAYLDDAIDNFLGQLEQMGVLKNTLVIVTSDESHGIDNVRLASAWGLNLILAPEQNRLPALKGGVYGHVDLTTSVLDYFGLPVPGNLIGRSLFRDYDRRPADDLLHQRPAAPARRSGNLQRVRFPAGLPALPQRGLHCRRSRIPRPLSWS